MIDLFKKVTGYIISFFVVHILDRILKFIPGVQEACNEIVRGDPRFLEFVSDNLMTQEMCNEAVEADPYTLWYVPHPFWMHEISKRAF